MNAHTEFFLAICGLILTGASVTASVMQYRAADLQARAAIVQLKPQIQVRSRIEKIDSDKFTDRRIEISNEGGPVYNFRSERLTGVVMTPATIPRKPGTEIEQTMYGYYAASFPTGNIKGELETIVGHRNNTKFFFIVDSFHDDFSAKWEISQPKTILHISYEDSLKEINDEYFLVDSGSVLRLTNEAGQTEWERARRIEKNQRPVDLDQLLTREQLRAWLGELETIRRQKEAG